MRRGTLAALVLGTAAMPLPAGGEEASDEAAVVAAGDLHLVPMDEVRVPIIESDRVSGSLRFKLVLVSGSDTDSAHLMRQTPVLRTAIVATGLEFARLNASGLRAVDVRKLDGDLTAALKGADPKVRRVLIVEVEAVRA